MKRYIVSCVGERNVRANRSKSAYLYTVESFKFMGPIFVDCWYFTYSWGSNFVGASGFPCSNKEYSV